jgi:aminopeptidase-like protein
VELLGLVEGLHPLHRTLASDGTDIALELVGEALPDGVRYEIESYTPGDPAWTWSVPERYVVREAWVETEAGQRIVDFVDSPLHLVSYSTPIYALLSWDELAPHLHVAAHRPEAIPWEFKYYERDWGFCLSKVRFDALDRSVRYRVRIDASFEGGKGNGLRIGTAVIHPSGGSNPDAGEFLVCAHICHPAQSNDDAAGVASAVGVAHRLAASPLAAGSMSVRFLFCPETIGSICFLAHNEELIDRMRGGVFVEMTGNENSLVLQRTLEDHSVLDRVAQRVFAARFGPGFRQGAFRGVIVNDEFVINGPGVGVPCLSVSRWPYPEYHTSDDNPSIIREERLREAADVVEEIVRIYASDWRPKRTFRGPVFLSGLGLWVDWRENPRLNAALDRLMLELEGDRSIFEIAEELEMDFWEAHEYLARFEQAGLVARLPLGSPGATARK